MTQPTPPPLQFAKAEFATAQPCVACKRPITGTYYAVNGKPVCPPCRERFLASADEGSGIARFSRALLYGIGAAIAGAILWYAIIKATGLQIGLIAILVGYMVGRAIKIGSKNRGGIAYQLLAVFLTYICIISHYIPEIYLARGDAVVHNQAILFAIIFAIAFIAPFLNGLNNILGLLIIGFGLYQAWKITGKPTLNWTGPHVAKSSAPSISSQAIL